MSLPCFGEKCILSSVSSCDIEPVGSFWESDKIFFSGSDSFCMTAEYVFRAAACRCSSGRSAVISPMASRLFCMQLHQLAKDELSYKVDMSLMVSLISFRYLEGSRGLVE